MSLGGGADISGENFGAQRAAPKKKKKKTVSKPKKKKNPTASASYLNLLAM